MKKKIKIEKEVDLALAECQIFARYWEDSEVNWVEDDAGNPKMPCVESVEHFYHKRKKLAWCPVINLDNGQIMNWPQGTTASIHYKSCDENVICIIDAEDNVVKRYCGYVPGFLCPKENGFGDYVIMDIDESGYIQNFNANLDDIFGEED